MNLENYTNINIFKKTYEQREISTLANVIEQPWKQSNEKQHAKGGFNPYVNNEGTTVGKFITLLTNYIAVAGKDFCIIAADTRMSLGYNILSRNHSKSTKLTDSCVITSGGMVADIETLHKLLVAKV